MKNEQLIRRAQELVVDRKIPENEWELIEKFVMPFGPGKFFNNQVSEGAAEWRNRELYDLTAVFAAQTLAASIHGSVTSPSTRWFEIVTGDKDLDKVHEVVKFYQECTEIIWNTLQESNFNTEINELYLDMVGFGNSCMLELPKDELNWDGIEFNTAPIKEIYFEEDENGNVLRLYRRLQWKPAQIISKFGVENVPERILKRAETSAVSERVTLFFCIYPEEANANSNTMTLLPPESRPYQAKYILEEGHEQVGKTYGYYEMPAFAVRWRKSSQSMWGYGPSHIALSTILTVNEYVKLVIKAAEKVIDPAIMVTERGLMSDLDLSPGGQTVVRSLEEIKVLESGARFDVSTMNIQDLRQMIRDAYHVNELQLKDSPQMSATESQIRYELMQRLLGPTNGRIQNDLLKPVLSTTFKILMRAGKLPAIPASLADGAVYDIQFLGPLSRAQKMDEVVALERFLGVVSTLANAFPEIGLAIDPMDTVKEIRDLMNVSADVLRTDAEMKKVMKEQREQQQQMQQAQIAAEQAKGNKDQALAEATGGMQ